MAAVRCALAAIGQCPRPEDLVDTTTGHLTVDYEVFSVYHPECCDNPDCDKPHDTTDPACERYVEPDVPDDQPYTTGHCTVCCDGWCFG